jgi:hypothetical protein
VQRWLVGLLAIVLLVVGAGLLAGDPSRAYEQYAAGCLRAGVLLAVFWLALPQTRPLKNRLALAAVLVAAVIIVVRPRVLLVLFAPPVFFGGVGLLVLWLVLRPRTPRRRPP